MPLRIFLHLSLAAALLAADTGARVAFAQSQPAAASAQSQPQTAAAQNDLAARVAAVERAFEEKRKEAGVPGASLVVVKDDKVVLLKASGHRDAARSLPATPDTLFAIGSCTKAFTAMAAVISQDDGKLSLEDPPKKHLPYFRLRDAEADAGVRVRHLLSHTTGLAGTEIAWYTGALSREEVIRAAGRAKPTAKLGEKFQYQNVMYSAAGEVVGRAQASTWESVVANRILKPLGMNRTVLSVAEMRKADDYSLGYELDEKTKLARPVPTRDLTNIAPAGSINSSAREMAEWVRLLTGGGAQGGRRVVSEKGFAEILTPRITVNPTAEYALGWAVTKIGGRKVYLHTGGIDGFGAMVAFLPEHKLGLAILSNVQGTPLLNQTLLSVVTNLLDEKPPATPTAAGGAQTARPQDEAGRYDFVEAKMVITIAFENGKLYADVPGQQRYTLEPVAGRRYRLAPLEDFFITFRPAKGKESETEAYLEQPHGNYTLPKLKPDAQPTAPAPANTLIAADAGPLKELAGVYEATPGGKIEVTVRDGKLILTYPGQGDFPLVEKERDVFHTPRLPDSYSILFRRDAAGKVSAVALKQPEGEFEFKRAADAGAAPGGPGAAAKPPAGVSLSVDELMSKVVAAAGGEANWRARRSQVTTASLSFENQGLEGEVTTYAQAPNSYARELTYTSEGKRVGTSREFFDGAAGGEEHSFVERSRAWPAKKLEELRAIAAFHQLPDWKTIYKSVSIKEVSQVGGEEAYVVVLTPEKGLPVTDYVSTKTFLMLRRDVLETPASGEGAQPVSIFFADYRNVGGVLVPFLITYQIPETGETVVRVREVKFDVPIPPAVFRAKK